MRSILLLLSVGLCAFVSIAGERTAPNIVYVLADDFGYGDAGCYNPRTKIQTPNIDRLAKEGMRFTDAHSGSSVCSPTRYGLLTGRYAWRTRLRAGVLAPYDKPLIAPERLTVPAFLKQHGYQTACIGKWHLGWQWPQKDGSVVFDEPIKHGPTARGFDYYFGTDVPNYPPYCFIENDRTVGQPTAKKEVRDLDGQIGAMLPGWKFDEILPALAAKSVDYIAERATDGKPFFLYFPLTSPHEPVAPSAAFKGKSGINDVADFLMETDWALGEVLKALDEHKLTANTLVIFTCDNGHSTYTGLQPLLKAGHEPSGGLRGYKFDIYEGGHRVPFIARWPGRVAAGSVCGETICHTNLLATCAEMLNSKLPENAGEDSFSILPLLLGQQRDAPAHPAVVHQAGNGVLAIRQGKWKLICGRGGANARKGEAPAEPEVQLFDLAQDLAEARNLAADNAEVGQTLRALLQQYIDNGRSTPGPACKNDVNVAIDRAAKK